MRPQFNSTSTEDRKKKKELFFSPFNNQYLSGNWKTIPTLSGSTGSGDWFGLPSFPYLWIQMDPEVGLLSPASSCKMEINATYTSHWIRKGGWVI